MRLKVFVGDLPSAFFFVESYRYVISYISDESVPISKALPVRETPYYFDTFPSQFEAFLPKAWHLHALGIEESNEKLATLCLIGKYLPGNLSFVKDGE